MPPATPPKLIALATAPSEALTAPVPVFNAQTALQQQQLVPAILVLAPAPPVPNLEGASNQALNYSGFLFQKGGFTR